MAKLISKTYGEALFELALEKNELDAVAEQVTLLTEAFAENPELMKELEDKIMSRIAGGAKIENDELDFDSDEFDLDSLNLD